MKTIVELAKQPQARPRWQRAAVPVGLLMLTALGSGVIWLRLQMAIERCVDAGGKWGHSDRRCTFVEPEEPQPILARPAAEATSQKTQ